MDETKAPGGLDASVKTIDPAVEHSGSEISKDSSTNDVADSLETSTGKDGERNISEPTKVLPAEPVKEIAVDAAKETPENEVKDSSVDKLGKSLGDEGKDPGAVTENTSQTGGKVNDICATEANETLKNGDSTGTKGVSDRVLEGQKWNNRDRTKDDYRKNVKSDLTSQEESSDAVAIRKQVRRAPFCHRAR